MKYIKWKGRNYGDELNDVLFPRRFGLTDWVDFNQPLGPGSYVLGIGTILNAYLRPGPEARVFVFGSGTGYKDPVPKMKGKILFVRGPLTCDHLGLKRSLFITDAAYALTEEVRAAAASEREFEYGLIPHHESEGRAAAHWKNPELHVISPRLPFADFVREVSRCRKVVTECLHGAITADILDIPYCVVQTSPTFLSFKWLDWTASLGMPLALHHAVPRELNATSLRHARFQLSKPGRRERAVRQIREKEGELREILARGSASSN